MRERPTQPDCFIIVDDELPGIQAKSKAPPADAAPPAPAAGAAVPSPPDIVHSDTDVSASAPVSPAPPIAAAGGCPPVVASRDVRGNVWQQAVDWAVVRQINEEGQQRGAAAARRPGRPRAWDARDRVRRASACSSCPGRAGARHAIARIGRGSACPPQGRPLLGRERDDIPSVGIDESRSPRPAAPAAGAAAAAPPVIGAPGVAPGQMAPESAAAAPAAPMVVDPAQMPEPTATELLERANAALRAREAELRQNEMQLAVAAAGAKEPLEEISRLNAQLAGWRRQQKEHDAQAEARDAELRELRRMLAECGEMLALARVMFLSLLER